MSSLVSTSVSLWLSSSMEMRGGGGGGEEDKLQELNAS